MMDDNNELKNQTQPKNNRDREESLINSGEVVTVTGGKSHNDSQSKLPVAPDALSASGAPQEGTVGRCSVAAAGNSGTNTSADNSSGDNDAVLSCCVDESHYTTTSNAIMMSNSTATDRLPVTDEEILPILPDSVNQGFNDVEVTIDPKLDARASSKNICEGTPMDVADDSNDTTKRKLGHGDEKLEDDDGKFGAGKAHLTFHHAAVGQVTKKTKMDGEVQECDPKTEYKSPPTSTPEALTNLSHSERDDGGDQTSSKVDNTSPVSGEMKSFMTRQDNVSATDPRRRADVLDAASDDSRLDPMLLEDIEETKEEKADAVHAESDSMLHTLALQNDTENEASRVTVDADTKRGEVRHLAPMQAEAKDEIQPQSDPVGPDNDIRKPQQRQRDSPNESTAKQAKENDRSPASSSNIQTEMMVTEVVTEYTKLLPLTSSSSPLERLTDKETKELEKVFDFQRNELSWDDDWVGDLSLLDIEISNPDGKTGDRSKRTLWWWADNSRKGLRLLNNVIRYVYNHPGTPQQAKRILASADPKSASSLQIAVQRVSYDPDVLKQDGWTTLKASEPAGASGGAFRIGEKVIWQNFIGVIIAYLHDDDLGDLWKAMWLDDLKTFDLELEELEEARKKYIRKTSKQGKDGVSSAVTDKGRRSDRVASSADFNVECIEHGIVMAISYAQGARHGVFWPARVLHASELRGAQGKRTKARQAKVDVVFLAPYWNSTPALIGSVGKRIDALSNSVARHGEDFFHAGPIFELESVDASSDTIVAYPYDASSSGLDLDELLTSFKFTGLPKAAFPRFVNSHRLALGFKTYSQQELKSQVASDVDRATASLMEAHPLSVQTAHFASAVLQLPFDHILSQMPHPSKKGAPAYTSEGSNVEPPLLFGKMLEAMAVPHCWGLSGTSETSKGYESPQMNLLSPPIAVESAQNGARDYSGTERLNLYLESLSALKVYLHQDSPFARILKSNLVELVQLMAKSAKPVDELTGDKKKDWSKLKYKAWIFAKTNGEQVISSELGNQATRIVKEWRRCCERIFKVIQMDRLSECENEDTNGTTWILTDYRCNMHLTSSQCFERPVRIPAAISAARQAEGHIRFKMGVQDKYIEKAENQIIQRAHKKSYIERMKKRCSSASQDRSVSLTEDSEGNGGHDTMGSKGTWAAALAAVGAALQATDMIMTGECLNVFCPTRPPGHHAGRELHAMKAISNGFCVLNTVACAAIYATMPLSEGGLGLSRVCVIDIDVHHGNGTQDILCSTYDPRFLYVSIHAGGAFVNGVDLGDDAKEMPHHLAGNVKKGIFPGRCGDTSPHDGVLNIPLGGRVTAHALGTALVTKVSPAVEKFSPELIIISAGFDAHKNDPLNMGGLSSQDFGTLTEVICKLAHKSCSGRVLSVLEGGYGVPCCRPQNFPEDPERSSGLEEASAQNDVEFPVPTTKPDEELMGSNSDNSPAVFAKAHEPMTCLDLGNDMPPEMKDVVASYALQKKLNRCHEEGFVHAVREHVSGLARCNGVR